MQLVRAIYVMYIPMVFLLQINGESTANMTYEEAMVKLSSATQLNLEVLHNKQG